jgi:hypothetical protein
MTKAILHIGTSKTGTSFLQQTLSASRDALVPAGFVYPRFGNRKDHTELSLAFNSRHSQRHMIFNIAVGPESRQWLTDTLNEQLTGEAARGLTGAETWVFSTENASRLQDADAAALIEFMREFFDEITVIVYLRRREFMLASRYSQARKAGRGSDFSWPDLIGTLVGEDPAVLVQRWRTVLGSDHLIVRPYLEAFKDASEDLLTDFCEATRLDQSILSVSGGGPALRNTSLSAEGVEFLRDLNDLMPAVTTSGKQNITLRGLVRRHVQHATPGAPLSTPPLVLDFAKAEFKESDDAVVRLLDDTDEWQHWLSQVVGQIDSVAQPEMTAARAVELLIGLSQPQGPVDFTSPDWRPKKPPPPPTTSQRIQQKIYRTFRRGRS